MLHFSTYEFDCPSLPNSGINMDKSFLRMLDQARSIAGIPFTISSGFRSKEYNQSLIDRGYKASKNSSHLVGKAADIKVRNGEERYVILNALIKAGFKRIGVAKGFINCDNDSVDQGGVKSNSVWTY